MASNLIAMASNLEAMASNLEAVASNLQAMASNLKNITHINTSYTVISDKCIVDRFDLKPQASLFWPTLTATAAVCETSVESWSIGCAGEKEQLKHAY